MTALDTKALRALAEAATPGPYEQWVNHAEVYCGPVDENLPGVISGGRGCLLTIDEDGAVDRAEAIAAREASADDDDDLVDDMRSAQMDADAAYFAALSPDVVLALLDRLDALTAIAAAAYDWRDVASQCAVAYGGGGVAAHARAAHYRLSDALDAAVQS